MGFILADDGITGVNIMYFSVQQLQHSSGIGNRPWFFKNIPIDYNNGVCADYPAVGIFLGYIFCFSFSQKLWHMSLDRTMCRYLRTELGTITNVNPAFFNNSLRRGDFDARIRCGSLFFFMGNHYQIQIGITTIMI